MSMLSSFLGLDRDDGIDDETNARYGSAMRQSQDPNAGMDQISKMTQAAMSSAMPSFLKQMQLTKEDGIRRGISTGDLGTSTEGDLASAFDRNMSNSVAGMAGDMYKFNQGNYLDLLTGKMDREQGAANDAAQRKSGFMGGLFKLGAAALTGGS